MERNLNANLKELLSLYKFYLMQANQEMDNSNIYCCRHDDSGGHPDYHCDTHDNIPTRGPILVK